jgi:hypothetical protein
MINLKYFKDLFESENINGSGITIDEFCNRIEIYPPMIPVISEWWSKNRSDIKIHLFPFGSIEPIAGVFLGSDTVFIINKMSMIPGIYSSI